MSATQTIKFEPNVPVTVALQYADGREVTSQLTGETQVMFSTVDGRRIYATPTLAAKIRETGVQPNEPVRVCKRTEGRTMRWEVQRIGDPPRSTAPAPEPPPSAPWPAEFESAPAPRHQQQQAGALSPMARMVASAFGAAFDGLTEMQGYAARKGQTFRFSEEDIRATANTILIQTWKHGMPAGGVQ